MVRRSNGATTIDNRPHYYEQAHDNFETALEASCGILMALESIRGHACDSAGGAVSAHARVQEAIEPLRLAITQLRIARSETVFPMALGFVAASPVNRRPQES
jgi:hypothetical protein